MIEPGLLAARQQFDSACNSSDAWRSVATDLLTASEALAERCLRESASGGLDLSVPSLRGSLGKVLLMLRGMATECLLKARWIARGNALFVDRKYRSPVKERAHDLPKLADAVDFPLTPEERHILERLSHFIEYGGRYPAPKKERHLLLLATPDGGHGAATSWATPTDERLFHALVGRLRI